MQESEELESEESHTGKSAGSMGPPVFQSVGRAVPTACMKAGRWWEAPTAAWSVTFEMFHRCALRVYPRTAEEPHLASAPAPPLMLVLLLRRRRP